MNEKVGSSFSWLEVKQEAIAGLLVVGAVSVVGGIGYIAYTVPAKLDRVISNQMEYKQRITDLEDEVKDHRDRITRLEVHR